ncbi:general transcription factor iie subunit 2 [Phtheirospermum japonicum]|uniref:General transcription factor iie subunit 2 n=1 Tax=Phtheirospermum japonicum TaxID=374723 RepID=A0A830C5Z5_9LAMI|nr:general transcription factor iie subunit 2 [Phtheirospermum japonicum]
MKRVIHLLYETRQALTPDQINEKTYVDINSNKDVFDSLCNNPKVRYDGNRFSYKPKHDCRNKDEVRVLVRECPDGIPVIDLEDSYLAVMDDLQSLKASGDIWLISNLDSKEDIAYPNDTRADIKVDNDLKQLFRGIELPRDMLDIEKDLQKNGMKPVTNTARRRAMAQTEGIPVKPETKRKKHEISKRTKLTNTHMPELFKHLKASGS